MTTLLASLLQAAFALYASAQNPAVNADLRAQANRLADRSLALYQSASTPWVNFNQLANADYTDVEGNALPLRNGRFTSASVSAEIIPEHTSFGDLNKDLLDDAVVVIQITKGAMPARYMLAAVLNTNQGTVRNAARLDLGQEIQVFDHRVQNGEFKLDMQADGGPRTTKLYRLEGGTLKLVNQI